MPEIDNDTFQVVALALSGLALLVSLVVLSAVGKLRKEVGEAARRTEDAAPSARASYETDLYDREPALAAQQPAAQQPVQQQPVRQQPAAQQPAAQQPAAQQPAAQQPAAQQPEFPTEQPFEREGRWWYKRGDELLVYNEGSGQWEPAPAGSLTGGAVTAPPVADTAYTPVGEASPAASGGETAAGEEAAGFWKCPSCGAVNGATASSCRMCFTAKP